MLKSIFRLGYGFDEISNPNRISIVVFFLFSMKFFTPRHMGDLSIRFLNGIAITCDFQFYRMIILCSSN